MILRSQSGFTGQNKTKKAAIAGTAHFGSRSGSARQAFRR